MGKRAKSKWQLTNKKKINHGFQRRSRCQSGSATMEYVIVSTFAALLSIAAITFVGRMVKTKVSSMADRIGMTTEEFNFDIDFEE